MILCHISAPNSSVRLSATPRTCPDDPNKPACVFSISSFFHYLHNFNRRMGILELRHKKTRITLSFYKTKLKEARSQLGSTVTPNVPVSADNFLNLMGWGDHTSQAGMTVNIDNALGVPAVWAATNFISGTLASLPLEVYRNGERVTTGVGSWLNRAVNPTTSSFAWRKYIFEQTLTGGRSITLIVKQWTRRGH